MTKNRLRLAWVPAAGVVAAIACPLHLLAEEEIAVEGEPADQAATATATAALPAAPAVKKAVRRVDGAVIKRVTVVPAGERIEIRIEGQGTLRAKIMKIESENKIVLDFPGTVYAARGIVLGEPGLGDIRRVRGAQNKPLPAPLARVVIELKKMVSYSESKEPGGYVISLATRGEAGPDEDASTTAAVSQPTAIQNAAGSGPASASSVTTADNAPVAGTPPNASAASETASPASERGEETAGGRSSVLHAMTTDLADRVRVVVTADGALRYKLASQDGGKELQLRLFDVDLKWSPARLVLKDGPIAEVRAEAVRKPQAEVRISIRLRQARPYHVRRDQNQVIIEVEKPAEAEQVGELAMKGDITHRVTLNVQNEDMQSLVKALAFEAGFDNVVMNASVAKVTDTVTISLNEVPFAKALNLILAPKEFIWKVERGVLRVGKEEEFDAELDASALSGGSVADSGGGSDEGGIVTRVFRLKYISVFDLAGSGVDKGIDVTGSQKDSQFRPASEVKSNVGFVLSSILVSKKKGMVFVDARSNSLIITDAASNMAKISRIIRELDIQVPQVHINARLVQINLDKVDTLGINWAVERAGPANPAGWAQGLTSNLQGKYQLAVGMLGQGFNLEGLLDVMQSRGDVRTLLNPSITTLHDRASAVTSSQQLSYMEISQEFAGGAVVNHEYAKYAEVPITLVVRPHVNPDKTIVLEVMIKMATVTQVKAGMPPDISTQEAATRLIVRNRETGVIGGILTDMVQKRVDKVPLLGSLPWFLGGALFRSERTDTVKMELVLFLTPTLAEEL